MTIECVCKGGFVYHNGEEVGTYTDVGNRRAVKFYKEFEVKVFEPYPEIPNHRPDEYIVKG